MMWDKIGQRYIYYVHKFVQADFFGEIKEKLIYQISIKSARIKKGSVYIMQFSLLMMLMMPWIWHALLI